MLKQTAKLEMFDKILASISVLYQLKRSKSVDNIFTFLKHYEDNDNTQIFITHRNELELLFFLFICIGVYSHPTKLKKQQKPKAHILKSLNVTVHFTEKFYIFLVSALIRTTENYCIFIHIPFLLWARSSIF